MSLWRDYLREKAKFYTPQPNSTQNSTSDVNEVEVSTLSEEWQPLAARRDPYMVDALINVLENFLSNRVVDPDFFNFYFQPIADVHGEDECWRKNTNEPEARYMVQNGALRAATGVLRGLGIRFQIDHEDHPPDYRSRVDFVLRGRDSGKEVLVEVKAPGVFDKAMTLFNLSGFRIRWPNRTNASSGIPTAEKVVRKSALYMASHHANWLALTSHDKWVFFRLHNHANAYLTFSEVLLQENNTKPFRALLGMMLATELNIHIVSRVNTSLPLPPIVEEDSTRPSAGPSRNRGASSRGGSSAGSSNAPSTAPSTSRSATSASIVLKWSSHKYPHSKPLTFFAVKGNELCSPLGRGSILFQLQRVAGAGSTGVVYEARLDVNGASSKSHHYAIKTVKKGDTREEVKCLERLYKEFNIYCVIERARKEGRIHYEAPRCYGLFETDYTAALILDYEGESLGDTNWSSLSVDQRKLIFNAIHRLHSIGIDHDDLEPRNVIRKADGTYTIIDFSSSRLHKCPGIQEINGFSGSKKSAECDELKGLWGELNMNQVLLAKLVRAN